MIMRTIRCLFEASLIAALAAVAPGQSRAANLMTLISFCSLANCTDGAQPDAGLIANADGGLFGITGGDGANNGGTAFELTGGGFIPPGDLAGTPGQANCIGKSVSGLAEKYVGFAHAAAALGSTPSKVYRTRS